jgi:hypothetical protein
MTFWPMTRSASPRCRAGSARRTRQRTIITSCFFYLTSNLPKKGRHSGGNPKLLSPAPGHDSLTARVPTLTQLRHNVDPMTHPFAILAVCPLAAMVVVTWVLIAPSRDGLAGKDVIDELLAR